MITWIKRWWLGRKLRKLHGFQDGDHVMIRGTESYDGVYTVERLGIIGRIKQRWKPL